LILVYNWKYVVGLCIFDRHVASPNLFFLVGGAEKAQLQGAQYQVSNCHMVPVAMCLFFESTRNVPAPLHHVND